jgi:hypothetical protein
MSFIDDTQAGSPALADVLRRYYELENAVGRA